MSDSAHPGALNTRRTTSSGEQAHWFPFRAPSWHDTFSGGVYLSCDAVDRRQGTLQILTPRFPIRAVGGIDPWQQILLRHTYRAPRRQPLPAIVEFSNTQ